MVRYFLIIPWFYTEKPLSKAISYDSPPKKVCLKFGCNMLSCTVSNINTYQIFFRLFIKIVKTWKENFTSQMPSFTCFFFFFFFCLNCQCGKFFTWVVLIIFICHYFGFLDFFFVCTSNTISLAFNNFENSIVKSIFKFVGILCIGKTDG